MRGRKAVPFLKHREGFTLFELILYLVIFGVLGIIGARMMGIVLTGKATVSRKNGVQLQMQKALVQIVDRVHAALTINDASTTLSLQMADATKNPTVLSLASNALAIKEGSAALQTITPSTTLITSLIFNTVTNPSPSTTSVQIIITGGYNSGDNSTVDPATVYTLETTAMPF